MRGELSTRTTTTFQFELAPPEDILWQGLSYAGFRARVYELSWEVTGAQVYPRALTVHAHVLTVDGRLRAKGRTSFTAYRHGSRWDSWDLEWLGEYVEAVEEMCLEFSGRGLPPSP